MGKTKDLLLNYLWLILPILILFACVFYLYMIEIFNFTAGNQDVKIVAATIALIGSIFAAIVTLIVSLMKRSIDINNFRLNELTENRLAMEAEHNKEIQRQAEKRLAMEAEHNKEIQRQAEKRLAMEAEHNKEIQRQAEKRLSIDTSLKAVNLLQATSNEQSVRTGALFALSNLGELDLALSLLGPLIEDGTVDAESAVVIINKGLISESRRNQHDAIHLMEDHAKSFFLDNGYFAIPDTFNLKWDPEISLYVREVMFKFILIMLEFISGGIKLPIRRIGWFLVMLDMIIEKETNGRIQCQAIELQLSLIEEFTKIVDENIVLGSLKDGGTITGKHLRGKAKNAKDSCSLDFEEVSHFRIKERVKKISLGHLTTGN